MLTRLVCSVLLASAALACGPDPAVPYNAGAGSYGTGNGASSQTPMMPSDMDCAGTAPTYERVTAFAKCSLCHASSKTGTDRKGAPESVNFDTAAAADANGDEAVDLVMAGVMPPLGSGVNLSETEKRQLYDWVMCRM